MSTVNEKRAKYSRNIRTLLAARGVTQGHIAEELGRTANYVTDRMKLRRAWTTDELDAISAFLGVPLSALCGETIDPKYWIYNTDANRGVDALASLEV